MPQPMPMHQIDIILLNKYNDNVITALHKAGVTEINFLGDEILKENDVSRDRPLERATHVSKNIIRINRILGSLKQFDTAKIPFLEDMLGIEKIDKINVSGKNHEEILKDSNAILSEIEPVISEIDNKLEILISEESEIAKNIEECKLCSNDVNAGDLGDGKFLYSIAGVSTTDLSRIEDELKKNFKNYLFESYSLEAKKGEEQQNSILIAVMRNKKQALDDLLNKYGVRILNIKGEGKVGEILEKLNRRLGEIKKKKQELNSKLKKIYNKYYQELLISKELLEIEKEICEAFVAGATTEKTSMLRFWVPENESNRVQKIIEKEAKNFCEISVKTDIKDAPVIMDNPKIIKPFEFITTMYGTPKYGNLDPTIFVIPILIFFIGMMVADAITGIVLIVIGLFIYKKYGPYSQGVKNLMTLIILCGLMAVIVGVVTGDYFGNLFHNPEHAGEHPSINIFGVAPGEHLPGQMFDPEKSDLYLFLQFAIILGLCHLILGTLLGFYNELRHGKIKEALTEYFGWSMFGFGLGVIFLSTKINLIFISIDNPLSAAFKFGSVAVIEAGGRVIPTIFGELGGLGVLLIATGLLLAFLKNKFMILIEFIDFFAFTLSYARITALLIAAGAVASAFNQLAGLAWSAPVVGPILGTIIFIIAQAVGMFLAILDGFVQSLRLVYVEHFSRYYQGGGKEFKPFKAFRRYTVE